MLGTIIPMPTSCRGAGVFVALSTHATIVALGTRDHGGLFLDYSMFLLAFRLHLVSFPGSHLHDSNVHP